MRKGWAIWQEQAANKNKIHQFYSQHKEEQRRIWKEDHYETGGEHIISRMKDSREDNKGAMKTKITSRYTYNRKITRNSN